MTFLRRLIGPLRRSLQLRVVSSTVLLGILAVSLIGFNLFQSVANGLQDDRVSRAEVETKAVAARIQEDFDNTDATQTPDALNTFASDEIKKVAQSSSASDRYVVFTRSLDNESAVIIDTVVTGGLRESPIPLALRQALDADAAHQQSTIIDLDRRALTAESIPTSWQHPTIPAVVVGTRVQVRTAENYDLFFIYPLDREQATLDLIRRLFLIGGALLVTLVGAIAWLVTRQVVSPVRRAAAVAERLSLGNLNERMSARGADDLALLGRSFNAMADHLQSQIRQLEDLSRVQQVFVSDVSHELRTPLTTIRMAADLIHDSRGEFPPALGRSAELLNTELDRFEELLADLLEISRFDAGAAALEPEQADLGGVVRRVVEAVDGLARRKETKVRTVIPKQGVVADVDARRVERIVRNLLVNAIEHGEGRPVTITVAQNATAAAIAVRDHGVGLRPGEAGLVFNRFWRADPARARTTGGTGLGLAISLEDARLHDGWLQAWGEPGQGSVFRLTLPRHAGQPIGESPLPLAPPELADKDATTKLRPYRAGMSG